MFVSSREASSIALIVHARVSIIGNILLERENMKGGFLCTVLGSNYENRVFMYGNNIIADWPSTGVSLPFLLEVR